ncbi:MAG: hypothetical protein U9P80_01595 [Thermodesulfobacteriota bacterium]|nr:hypothetical protein [Thermodesulfobacteriota bacterium]
MRIFEYLHSMPPGLKDLSEQLGIAQDELSRISRRLEKEGIIGVITGGAGERFYVLDHTRIEVIEKDAVSSGMEDEVLQFKDKQSLYLKHIEESLGKKDTRANMFDELTRAFKDPSGIKKKKNPLD